MAIRKNTNTVGTDISGELRDILMRNGMQAHIVQNGDGYRLAVQGHDSPLLTYALTPRQAQALADWGTNSADKKAYDTFVSIVADDFDLPKNFVSARNANGRVAMGLHGYRIGSGEYGRGGMLGWTPRQQDGFHLRRVGGQVFYQGGPMVAERPDGRLKPGELQGGGYGFYYKGSASVQTAQQQASAQDVLHDLQTVITPITPPRSQEPATPYNELVNSPVYFSNEKWQTALSSHGIIVDEGSKTLTVQSDKTDVDMVYDLTDDELDVLTSNSIQEHSIEERIGLLNNIIKDDFAGNIALDTLNSSERLQLELHPEVQQEFQQRLVEQSLPPNEMREPNVPLGEREQYTQNNHRDDCVVYGQALSHLNGDKGWYREGKNGREVDVGRITVAPVEGEGKYRMTAVINGEAITHEISQKQYDKFMAVDDYHRMVLFSKVFNEVDMKNRPEAHSGLGMKIFAALTAGATVSAELARGRFESHGPAPELYGERFVDRQAAHVYYKPGVDSPQDVASRAFEAEANRMGGGIGLGR